MNPSSSNTYRSMFQANLESLDDMMQWVREHSMRAGFSSAEMRKLELAMEEALVNVIQHAYKNEKGTIEIICNVLSNGLIQFTIKDKGSAFNPLLQSHKIDLQASLEERPEGGVGILLMLQYMDEVHYERQHPYNVLTLVKKKS
jgi:anti-sigma regulatory factor (Ser/Thr protein kinase)